MLSLGAGWLNQQRVPERVHRVFVPEWSEREQASFPTRRTEYHFVALALAGVPRGIVCDAGAGFNPEIHLMPEIVGAMGYDVVAIDANATCMVMPQRVGVVRALGSMLNLPLLDATCVAWLCISTLEHMLPWERVAALHEAQRVLKPGGVAIVTADEIEPEELNRLFTLNDFEVGAVVPFDGEHLTPRVAWCVAKKRG